MYQLKPPKKITTILAICFAISCFSVVFCYIDFLSFDRLKSNYIFDSPSYASTNGQQTVLIDEGKTKIVSLNEQNQITAILEGDIHNKKHLFAFDSAVCDQNGAIYVAGVCYKDTGTKIQSEWIAKYRPNGTYQSTVYEITYQQGEEPLQYGNIKGLQLTSTTLSFFIKSDDQLHLYSYDTDLSSLTPVKTIKNNLVCDMVSPTWDSRSSAIYFSHKLGKIYKVSNSGIPECIYTSETPYSDSFESIPYDIGVDTNGNLYFSDIGTRQIINLSDNRVLVNPSSSLADNPIFYRISVDENTIATTNDQDLLIYSNQGVLLIQQNSAAYAPSLRIFTISIFLCALLFLICLLYFLSVIIRKKVFRNLSNISKISLILGLTCLISATFVSVNILSTTQEKTLKSVSQDLLQTAQIISQQPIGKPLSTINSLSDYNSSEYTELQKNLDGIIDASYQSGSNQYYVLYKVKNGILFGVMDSEDTSGSIYPISGSFSGSLYESAMTTDQIVLCDSDQDQYGLWAYALTPIYDESNQPVGLLEVGTNLYSFHQTNREFIQTIAWNVITLVTIMIVLLTEFFYCSPVFLKHEKEDSTRESTVSLIRLVSFSIFFTASLQDSFLPVLSSELYAQTPLFLPQSIGAALPLSLELLFTGIASPSSGCLVDKFGVKKVFIAGLLLQSSGLILCGAFLNYFSLVFGKIIIGCGIGITLVCLRFIAASDSTPENKTAAFSALNSGMLAGIAVSVPIGATIFSLWGNRSVFLLDGILVFLIALPVFCIFKRSNNTKKVKNHSSSGPQQCDMKLIDFLKDRRVLSFFFLILIPFSLMLYFKDYYFPIFATDHALSITTIGQIFLFVNVLIIYTGPAITKYMIAKLGGKRSVVAASILYASSILVFAIVPSLFTSVFVVFITAVGASFGYSCQSIYYSDLPIYSKFGEAKASGVYNLFENVGQTIGPIVLGFIMLIPSNIGFLIAGVTLVILTMLFILINRERMNKKCK